MTRSTTSFRLDDDLRESLSRLAQAEGTSVTSVVERLLREGLAMDQHPGIIFNPGPTGRRAAISGTGLDVWEIISSLRYMSGPESERITALAEDLEIHEQNIRIALDYAAAHRQEIEARMRANDEAFDEAERLAQERKRLLEEGS